VGSEWKDDDGKGLNGRALMNGSGPGVSQRARASVNLEMDLGNLGKRTSGERTLDGLDGKTRAESTF